MQTFIVLTTISTSLSICGCIIIFLAHKCWKEIRSNSRNILLYITIADLLTAVGYLFGLQSDWEYSCKFQSFVTTTSSMMSFFWTSCMALYLHVVSVNANFELGKRIIFAFHCIAWPVPILITLIALLSDKLGKSCVGTVDWCWIQEGINCTNAMPRFGTVSWMLVTGKLWEIMSYVLIIVVYARVWWYVRKQRKLVEGNSADSVSVARFRAVETRTILIPGFFIFIRIWGTLQFLVYAFTGSKDTNVLQYFQACGDASQGFVNAILFCFVADKMKAVFHKCCHRQEGEQERLLPQRNSVQRNNGNQI